MDVATVLREVDSWPVEQRLRLVEALWDSIVDAGELAELTDAQRVELNWMVIPRMWSPGRRYSS